MSMFTRYRERLGDERVTGNGVERVDLERGLFRSTVSLRVFGRRVAHRTLRDRQAEKLYEDAAELLMENRLMDAVELIRKAAA